MVNLPHFSAFYMISLYIHIPFCVKKCDYCAFYSISSTEKVYEEYTNALIHQINTFKFYENVKTIYFGGGTPSVIGSNRLNRILDALKNRFDLSGCEEITLEVNPKTTSLDELYELRMNGFNRLSIGLQSTNNDLLDSIGRIHTFEDYLKTLEEAKNAGFTNISTDLIYGLPDQLLSDHLYSVKKLVELDVKHISVYSLSIEPNTRMYQFRDSYIFPDEDEEFQMYLSTSEFLENNGFLHYEISNFAKHGFESKHNNGYWTGIDYIGFGTSAHSFYDRRRFSCDMSIEDFINNANRIEDYFLFTDCHKQKQLDNRELEEERVMLMLRLKDGVELNDKQAAKANIYINAGYMVRNNGRYSMTPSGWYVSNSIITNILSE